VNAGRRVLIAANPKSGAGPKGQLVQALSESFILRGYQSEVIHSLDHLQATANRLHSQHQLEAVISAGGDGTVSTLANLLPQDVPLLIFPLGTENLLAKYWGMTNDVELACTTLVGGRTVHMDVGCANGKLFLVMLGCGFDAEVVRQMHQQRSGHINRWSYTMPILRTLKNYSFPQLSWTINGILQSASTHCWASAEEQHAAWLFVFNVPRYAASLDFCPQADPTDGKLDICTFKRSGRWPGFNYLLKLWQGKHQQLDDFKHNFFRRLTIPAPVDSAGNTLDVPYQLDGDPGGILPLEVQVLPARLKLIVPETTATSDPIPVLPLAVSSA
jgi:diacylglycerol kinase (ATP)